MIFVVRLEYENQTTHNMRIEFQDIEEAMVFLEKNHTVETIGPFSTHYGMIESFEEETKFFICNIVGYSPYASESLRQIVAGFIDSDCPVKNLKLKKGDFVKWTCRTIPDETSIIQSGIVGYGQIVKVLKLEFDYHGDFVDIND